MINYSKSIFLIAIIAVLAVGCGDHIEDSFEQDFEESCADENGEKDEETENTDAERQLGPVDFEIIDPESLDDNLKEKVNFREPEQTMTIVEDDGYQYILISAGRKPTTGYSIRIGSFEGFENLMVLDALLYPPSEECDVDRVETYPSLLLRIAADDREVVMYLTNVRDPVFR